MDEEVNSPKELMTTTAQTSVLIRFQELVNHPYASSVFILEWVNQGNALNGTNTRRAGQTDREDRRTEWWCWFDLTVTPLEWLHQLIRATKALWIYTASTARLRLLFSLSTNLSRCNQMSSASTLILTQEVQTAGFVREVCAPSIRVTFWLKHKDSHQISPDQIRSDQIRSFPTRLLSSSACFWILIISAVECLISILRAGKKNTRSKHAGICARSCDLIRNRGIVSVRTTLSSESIRKVWHKKRACANTQSRPDGAVL